MFSVGKLLTIDGVSRQSHNSVCDVADFRSYFIFSTENHILPRGLASCGKSISAKTSRNDVNLFSFKKITKRQRFSDTANELCVCRLTRRYFKGPRTPLMGSYTTTDCLLTYVLRFSSRC